MTAGIFISYRRQDALEAARAIYERLRAEFGHENVFIDLEGLDYGVDFVKSLDGQLQHCQVLLALIGPQWLAAPDGHGGRRLDDENDFVRIELRTALQRDIRVVPVLLNGAALPRTADLPADLQPLLRRQALELDFRRFDGDIARLVGSLRKMLNPSAGAPPPPRPPAHDDRVESQPLLQRVSGSGKLLLGLGAAAAVAFGASRLGGKKEEAPAVAAAAPAPASIQVASSAEKRGLAVGDPFRDCDDDSCPWLRVLPAGRFTMGSPDGEAGRDKDEGPQHEVTISKPFAVMETEVTVGLFKAFVKDTGHKTDGGCWVWNGKELASDPGTSWRKPFAALNQTDHHPVVCVNWDDAQTFARWMAKRTGQSYRLLSEAEWEYAARAGNPAAYSFGADPKQSCGYANIGDLSTRKGWPQWNKDWVSAECDDAYVYTAPVGSFQPNAFGLYDMHGNAWEWVQDCQNDYKAEPRTAEAVESSNCANRLLRGGGWFSSPGGARSAGRDHFEPSDRFSNTGFRLARMLP